MRSGWGRVGVGDELSDRYVRSRVALAVRAAGGKTRLSESRFRSRRLCRAQSRLCLARGARGRHPAAVPRRHAVAGGALDPRSYLESAVKTTPVGLVFYLMGWMEEVFLEAGAVSPRLRSDGTPFELQSL